MVSGVTGAFPSSVVATILLTVLLSFSKSLFVWISIGIFTCNNHPVAKEARVDAPDAKITTAVNTSLSWFIRRRRAPQRRKMDVGRIAAIKMPYLKGGGGGYACPTLKRDIAIHKRPKEVPALPMILRMRRGDRRISFISIESHMFEVTVYTLLACKGRQISSFLLPWDLHPLALGHSVLR
jgi:hypothetical protein